MSHNGTLWPSIAVATSGAMWGLWWLPLRQLEANGLGGDWASVVLYSLALLLSLPYLLRRWPRFRAGGLPLLGIGLLSGGAFTLWNHALIDGNVVRVTLLFYLAPVWATAINFLLFREAVRGLRLLSILLGFIGAATVLGIEQGLSTPMEVADWFALASGIGFAVCAVWARRAQQVGGVEKTIASAGLAVPVALLLALTMPATAAAPAMSVVWSNLPVVLLCMIWIIPLMWMVLWGAAYVDAGRVAILLLLEIVAAAVSSAIFTDEPFGARELLGCGFILVAGLLEGLAELQATRSVPRPAPALQRD